MIPASDEDKLRSLIYCKNPYNKKKDYTEYLRECQRRFEEERLAKPWFFGIRKLFSHNENVDLREIYIEDQEEDCQISFHSKDSLEARLEKLAYEYRYAPSEKKRKINRNAMLMIRRCSSCRNNPEVIEAYYKMYIQLKRISAQD